MAEVAEVHVYPVKSLQGISLESATLTPRGLENDRRWMIVDADGTFVTQRQLPEMAQIKVSINEERLTLSHVDSQPLELSLKGPISEPIQVKVWDDVCLAHDEGAEPALWLTEALGVWNGGGLRLVRFAENFERPVDPDFLAGESADTAFADGYPFLVTSEASLRQLNQQLIDKGSLAVPMSRFRPNIVLSNIEPEEEHRLDAISAQNLSFELKIRKPCQRCKVTTIDQSTGTIESVKEPLKTLAENNPYPDLKGAFFGQNATLAAGRGHQISVGDLLQIELKSESES